MRTREGEAERQTYLTKRMNDADIATREYVSKHAYEIGFAAGFEKGFEKGLIIGEIAIIHLAQRLGSQSLTPVEELKKLDLPELTALLNQLEDQLLSQKGKP